MLHIRFSDVHKTGSAFGNAEINRTGAVNSVSIVTVMADAAVASEVIEAVGVCVTVVVDMFNAFVNI